ncbi:hypothetical protein IV102_03895 [bacterium]|nr:hypothetical protein [bacterium]
MFGDNNPPTSTPSGPDGLHVKPQECGDSTGNVRRGKFAESLTQLTGNYLKTIPTCPMSRSDTHSGGYEQGPSFTSAKGILS